MKVNKSMKVITIKPKERDISRLVIFSFTILFGFIFYNIFILFLLCIIINYHGLSVIGSRFILGILCVIVIDIIMYFLLITSIWFVKPLILLNKIYYNEEYIILPWYKWVFYRKKYKLRKKDVKLYYSLNDKIIKQIQNSNQKYRFYIYYPLSIIQRKGFYGLLNRCPIFVIKDKVFYYPNFYPDERFRKLFK